MPATTPPTQAHSSHGAKWVPTCMHTGTCPISRHEHKCVWICCAPLHAGTAAPHIVAIPRHQHPSAAGSFLQPSHHYWPPLLGRECQRVLGIQTSQRARIGLRGLGTGDMRGHQGCRNQLTSSWVQGAHSHPSLLLPSSFSPLSWLGAYPTAGMSHLPGGTSGSGARPVGR